MRAALVVGLAASTMTIVGARADAVQGAPVVTAAPTRVKVTIQNDD